VNETKMPTCEYELDDPCDGVCGRRAEWACDIGGGQACFCDEHKRLCEEGEEQLPDDDPRKTPYYRIRKVLVGVSVRRKP